MLTQNSHFLYFKLVWTYSLEETYHSLESYRSNWIRNFRKYPLFLQNGVFFHMTSYRKYYLKLLFEISRVSRFLQEAPIFGLSKMHIVCYVLHAKFDVLAIIHVILLNWSKEKKEIFNSRRRRNISKNTYKVLLLKPLRIFILEIYRSQTYYILWARW
jgi:hypothetical protein